MNDKTPGTLPEWLAPHVGEVASWGPAPAAPSCWVTGCRRDAHLHGLCKTHHLRAQRAWNPRPSQERYRRAGGEAVMNEHENPGVIEVIDRSRARADEEQAETPEGVAVIDLLRAPARDLHETWREDATKTPRQLMAEEGVDRKEATRRVRWARRQQKRMDAMTAVMEELNAKRLARKTTAGRTSSLEAGS